MYHLEKVELGSSKKLSFPEKQYLLGLNPGKEKQNLLWKFLTSPIVSTTIYNWLQIFQPALILLWSHTRQVS